MEGNQDVLVAAINTLNNLRASLENSMEEARILKARVEELEKQGKDKPMSSELQKLLVKKVPVFNCERTAEAVLAFQRDFPRGVQALGIENDEAAQMNFLLSKFGNQAQTWKERREKEMPILATVAEWVAEIRKVFYPSNDQDLAELEFSKLTQGMKETAGEYVDRVESLLRRLPAKSEEDISLKFVAGLRYGLRVHVRAQRAAVIVQGQALSSSMLFKLAINLEAEGFEEDSRQEGNKAGIQIQQVRTKRLYHEWSEEKMGRYEKGECFKCGLLGHKANDPDFHPRSEVKKRKTQVN